MLPAIPATFGRLSDVFASSLGAITGDDNRLSFRPAKRVVAVLVDGLGAQNLKAAGGHAQFLNKALAESKTISCGFPSTTAVSITSFGTGLSAGEHGLVGYKVFDREANKATNLLTGWNSQFEPRKWQPHQTITEKAIGCGVGAFFIGSPAYDGSGFTSATMAGAQYLAGKTIADRVDLAIKNLREVNDDQIMYLYVPELDQIAHAEGVSSNSWLQAVEELDSQLRRLSGALAKSDGMLVTADHGVVDVPAHKQIFLDEVLPKTDLLVDVSGEPRVNFVYLADVNAVSATVEDLNQSLDGLALALTRKAVLNSGWYGPSVSSAAKERMPDIFVLATKQVAIYHRDFAPAKSLEMVGQHGGLSAAELTVPLLKFGSL